MSSVVEQVAAALDRIDSSDRTEVWIHRPDRGSVLEDAASVDARLAAGEHLPLAGSTVAVKNNIDVAGWPTSAACPAFEYVPDRSATVVDRLRAAGAVIVGSTNMDQFATGLVGTRSPFGAVRNATHPAYISGGSSAGSAVAVALGLVDLALGTDTAGSGRVPAAFGGIVGIKPTRGLLSAHGVVPACRSLDCVSVFARDVDTAAAAAGVCAGTDPNDAWSRQPVPARDRSGSGRVRRVGVASQRWLDEDPDLDVDTRAALAATVERLVGLGLEVVEVDIEPFIEAGRLLYEGAFLAERYTAVGAFIDAHPDEVDAVVGSIIGSGRDLPAHRLCGDLDRLAGLRQRSDAIWTEIDALLLPTVPTVFTLAEIAEEPIARNSVLGRYTNCCNLLDLAAIAVPAGERVDAPPVGVTFFGPAWSDDLLAALAARFLGENTPPPMVDVVAVPATILVAVVGAHLTGQPLNHQLTSRGGVLVRSGETAPSYRLHALDTVPPKPGLVRVGASQSGASIEVEVWELGAAEFGDFVASIPPPMCIGTVELADGESVPGFLCEPSALEGAPDITSFGGWRRFLAEG